MLINLERGIVLNNNNENYSEHIKQEVEKKSDILQDKRAVKGDIDDYIFSWQTVKLFSER